MAMALLQAGSAAFWRSGGFWVFIVLLVIAVFSLLRYTWWSPTRRR